MNVKTTRIALLVAISIVLLILIQHWHRMYPQPVISHQPPAVTANKAQATTTAHAQLPNFSTDTSSIQVSQSAQTGHGKTVKITTDLFDLHVRLDNAEIISAKLRDYTQSLKDKTLFSLLHDTNHSRYTFQGRLLGNAFPANMPFKSAQSHYDMTGNQLTVDFTWTSPKGVSVIKRLTFERGRYLVKLQYLIQNGSAQPVYTRVINQLVRTAPQKNGGSYLTSYADYTGGAISTEDKHYQKVSFSDMVKGNLEKTVTSGWVAMIQHYFLGAIIPTAGEKETFFSRVYQGKYYAIGAASPSLTVAPGQSIARQSSVYLGPAITDRLKSIAPYLDLSIDYGWLWFISEIIFWVIEQIQTIVGNWGWSIVLVTVLIKLLFYPLSAKSFRSMAKMRQLQPRMLQLKEQYGNDRQKMGQETMALYRKEGVNPLSGCLPMLVQIPVFIALYWVIMENIQFRQASFILWIKDLAEMDPYYILPVLMGISMFIQQRLNPPPPDPMQAKIMMALPFVFTIMFLHFPSGLVLYWFVNNCLGILQQWFVNHRINAQLSQRG